jgi:glycosyltransferase involved in cell wall biosynthesis
MSEVEEKNPLVTIIVRTKDRPKLLKRALQSISAQTYRPIEVVLVNDGGCDLPEEELKEILGDVSLNYVRLEKNTGRAHAGNVGIENAKGEYIGFLDDDDKYHTEFVEKLQKNLIEHNVSLAFGKCDCIKYENGNKKHLFTLGKPFDKRELFFRNFIPINSFLIKKEPLLETGGFDTKFEILEDWDILFKLAQKNDFFFVDEVLSEYSVFDSATVTCKGGVDSHNKYRDLFYKKHSYFLNHDVVDHGIDMRINERYSELHDSFCDYKAELDLIKNSKSWKTLQTYRAIKGFNKRKIGKLIDYLSSKDSALPYNEDEGFLGRFTNSEWTEYELWLFRNRLFTLNKLKELYKEAMGFKIKPKISILMPLYNPKLSEFKQAIDSIMWQIYPNWELCIVDDSSSKKNFINILSELKDKRIKFRSRDSHSGIAVTSQCALEMAAGEYIALMDQDDELHPDAFYSFVKVLQAQDIDLFYSDRDMISPQGKRYMHFFKPGWSPEYLLSNPYVSHLEIFNKSLILKTGGFRNECVGSQDYDLTLRVTEKTDKIYHFPMILYSYRQSSSSISKDPEAKKYTYESAIKALKDAVKRRNLPVKDVVENSELWRGNYKIIWDKAFLSDKNIFLITIGRDERETNRLKRLFDSVTDSLNIDFISTDYSIKNINRALKSIHQEGFVFFCDDTVTEIVSSGLIDMLGYLSIDGVDAVGCKFLDFDNKIFSVGLSITNSGRVLFSYRGSSDNENGYGAIASMPRNVSAVFPSFWGCKVSALNERGYLKSGMGYIQSAMSYFMEIIKSGKRITCVPYMCLRVDKGRLNYDDDMKAFAEQWIKKGIKDKYYNPNLSDINEDYSIKR